MIAPNRSLPPSLSAARKFEDTPCPAFLVDVQRPKRRRLLEIGLALSWPLPAIANELRQDSITEQEIRSALLSFMAIRRPHGTESQKQLLNGYSLELWDVGAKKIFFSAPQSVANIDSTIAGFVRDPKNRLDAAFSEGRLSVLGRSIARTPEKYHLIAIDESNFRISNDKTISVQFGPVTYSVTVLQVAHIMRNRHIYGGALRVRATPEGVERPAFLNHGAMVSMPGEPALRRLVESLVRGARSPEERYQRLLDFVTNSIAYDEREFYFGREFLQRANETLIGRIGDCSNKVILFASMLEQLSLPYLLVYSNNHITTAVPRGSFPNTNSYGFFRNETLWLIAETTAKGFKIGETRVVQESLVKKINYIQEPRERNALYDYPRNRLIMFG
jgi:hypothetical protein